jgi:hypothetical protein
MHIYPFSFEWNNCAIIVIFVFSPILFCSTYLCLCIKVCCLQKLPVGIYLQFDNFIFIWNVSSLCSLCHYCISDFKSNLFLFILYVSHVLSWFILLFILYFYYLLIYLLVYLFIWLSLVVLTLCLLGRHYTT